MHCKHTLDGAWRPVGASKSCLQHDPVPQLHRKIAHMHSVEDASSKSNPLHFSSHPLARVTHLYSPGRRRVQSCRRQQIKSHALLRSPVARKNRSSLVCNRQKDPATPHVQPQQPFQHLSTPDTPGSKDNYTFTVPVLSKATWCYY